MKGALWSSEQESFGRMVGPTLVHAFAYIRYSGRSHFIHLCCWRSMLIANEQISLFVEGLCPPETVGQCCLIGVCSAVMIAPGDCSISHGEQVPRPGSGGRWPAVNYNVSHTGRSARAGFRRRDLLTNLFARRDINRLITAHRMCHPHC